MKFHFKIIAIILCLSFFTLPIYANDKAQKIDELLSKYHEYGHLNGSVLVAEHGKVIYKKGFGFANFEWEIPNQPDTKFRLASVTKQFTAMLILQLVEEGKLELEGRLSDYLPYYGKNVGEQVTIHQLLNHTSGIPSYTGLPGFMQNEIRNFYPVEEFVKKFCSGDLEFEPGEKFAYNNSGYFLLGAVIESVTGKTYEDLLSEKIFEPLNMVNSGYDRHQPVIKNRAAGYNKTLVAFQNAPFLEMMTPYAAGSLYSTVEDLYLWDQALYTDKLISKETKEKMFTPNLGKYGYGWRIDNFPMEGRKKDVTLISHNGGIHGFNTRIARFVEDQHLIVILRNSPGASINQITRNIAAILYDQPVEPLKKSGAEAVAKKMLDSGIQSGLALYKDIKKNHSDEYDLNEGRFNNVGYQLINLKKLPEAIEIFKLNVAANLQSANTYDSLAEAYMVNGETALAIKYYNKALKMIPNDPGLNEQRKEGLKKSAMAKLQELQQLTQKE